MSETTKTPSQTKSPPSPRPSPPGEGEAKRPKELLVGYWRVKFLADNNCEIGGRLIPVKKGQTADVAKHIGEHLVHNGIAEKIAE